MHLNHLDFVDAMRNRKVTAHMLKSDALSIVRRAPDVFGEKSWDVMRGCGCLPWPLWIGAIFYFELSWWAIIATMLLPVITSSSAYNALGQEAVNAVIEQCLKDEVLYYSLLSQCKLLVAPLP